MLQSKDFSVSGDSESGNRYTFILRITELSADVITNSSRLQVEAILKQSIVGTGFSTWGTGVSCSLNGSEIFSDYAQRRISGKQEHVFYTWEGDIPHNDDGSLQLSVSGRLWQNASASFTPPRLEVEGEMALTIIARASSINASSGNIGETVMIAVGKKNDRFTHTIAYRFGEEAGYIDADGNAVADVAVNTAGAAALIQWLLTEEAKTLAAEYGMEEYGNTLFYVKDDAPVYEGEIAAATEETKVIRLSTTTSVNDSGLLGKLIPEFEAKYGYTVEVYSAGTGKSINNAKMGNADLILVHSKSQEEAFIADGFARVVPGFEAERVSFIYNAYRSVDSVLHLMNNALEQTI